MKVPMRLNSEEDEGQTWEWWNTIRILIGHLPNFLLGKTRFSHF